MTGEIIVFCSGRHLKRKGSPDFFHCLPKSLFTLNRGALIKFVRAIIDRPTKKDFVRAIIDRPTERKRGERKLPENGASPERNDKNDCLRVRQNGVARRKNQMKRSETAVFRIP